MPDGDMTLPFSIPGDEHYLDIDLSFSLEYYSNYLSAIERFLERESVVVRERYLHRDETYGDGSYLEALGDFFSDLLRKSFFVAIYSLFEKALNDICEGRNSPLSLNDLSGKGIERARKYLTKVAGVNFPAEIEMEWDALKDYQKLRNCLVHAQGELASCGKDGEYLQQSYIPKHPYLSIRGGEVILHKGFCEEVIENARKFFTKLSGAL